MKNIIKKEDGVALYMSLMMLSVIMAIGMGLTTLTLGQLRTARDIGNSVIDIYAADAGIERGLYKLRKTGGLNPCTTTSDCVVTSSDAGVTPFVNNASYNVTVLDGNILWCPAGKFKCLRSIGSFSDTSRAFELSF
ncbi:MAG: pilus assembly PilX N-terminal domain-containing protein [Candidatus Spechtbacterales bacterium]